MAPSGMSVPVQACAQEESYKTYKSWLKLLSVLKVPEVLGVLSSIQQSESCMERILANRLHTDDIPVLAKVLSGDQFSTCWKQLVYSLALSEGDILKLDSQNSFEALKQLLKKWASKFPNASVELLKKNCRCVDMPLKRRGILF